MKAVFRFKKKIPSNKGYWGHPKVNIRNWSSEVFAHSELAGPAAAMSDQLHPPFLQVGTSEDPSFLEFSLQHLAASPCEITPILASPLGALVHIYWQLCSAVRQWDRFEWGGLSQDAAPSTLPNHLTTRTQLLHLKVGISAPSSQAVVWELNDMLKRSVHKKQMQSIQCWISPAR